MPHNLWYNEFLTDVNVDNIKMLRRVRNTKKFQ